MRGIQRTGPYEILGGLKALTGYKWTCLVVEGRETGGVLKSTSNLLLAQIHICLCNRQLDGQKIK